MLKQLEARFGVLPEPVVTTIRRAGSDELDRLAGRVLQVTEVGELFE